MAAVVMIMDLIGGEGIRYMEIARLDYAVLSICLKTSVIILVMECKNLLSI